MSTLFSPLALGPLTLQNRIIVAPMCQYSAKDGQAQDWHLMHLGGLALSGAGLLITEATAVEPEGRISAADLGLYDDATEAALGRVLHAVRKHSSIPVAVQLAHAGRKASCALPWQGGQFTPPDVGGWLPVAPSPLPYTPGDLAPKELDLAGIARIRDAFVASAKRAARLGVDAVELHAAHGYLLHEFLSPLSNRRTDEYGGSLENRMRLVLEVFAALREVLPAPLALGVRISASDWVDGGWDVEQSIALSHRLKALGAAYIHVSSGGLSPDQQIVVGPGYQVPFASAIRRETGLATIAVGLITEAGQAEGIVAGGQADAVALARGMLFDPRWPWHAAALLDAQVDCPPQYLRCQPHGFKTLLRNNGRG
ncbi:MAG: NADH:flavin oxidoreductase/NADH oxidase [Humidesulfovibrio sp.]|nr:NADH:flavin oxidoreductase/NADH oxidase [Humidesulfovibrio sp.]